MSRQSPLTVLSVFSGDLWAGAEVLIFHLLNQLKDDPALNIVALTLNEGVLTSKLREAGVETHVVREDCRSFAQVVLDGCRLLQGRSIDIIHSHRYKENLLALLLAKLTGIPRLTSTVHGWSRLPLPGQSAKASASLTTRLDYLILKRFFTKVVAVSQDLKQTLVQRHGFAEDQVHVIHNGIPVRSKPPAPGTAQNGRLHIGTVGRLVPVKDFALFLEMAAALRKHKETVEFSILGDGPLRHDLLAKTRALKLDDSLRLLSPQVDPLPYYRSLDLYVNTSIHEGIPISVLEAMACAKAVVAPKVGGLPEIVASGTEGLLVERRETQAFAHSCLSLLNDDALRLTMGRNAWRRVASHYNDATMARHYQALYRQLAA